MVNVFCSFQIHVNIYFELKLNCFKLFANQTLLCQVFISLNNLSQIYLSSDCENGWSVLFCQSPNSKIVRSCISIFCLSPPLIRIFPSFHFLVVRNDLCIILRNYRLSQTFTLLDQYSQNASFNRHLCVPYQPVDLLFGICKKNKKNTYM